MQNVTLHDKSFRPFLTEKEIQDAIKQLAKQLQKDYQDTNPIFIGILNGSFLFTADLVREFDGNCEVTFLRMASYEGTESTGDVQTVLGIKEDITNRNVIIIEDIVDTGNTVEKLYEVLSKEQPSSLKVATLLFKPNAYQKNIPIDYVAITVGNEFLVGYGLDYDGLGRNLKDIYIIND
ncbi:MAG: hypoxanthine phosphoribosyltransferase [Flavobacteriales bacterium]|jgi:hypoxanthine phosphoribosyltransferase|nr:hypoxanthine phosphoribosyltransferase [Flavobacteriales bacterium]